MSKIRELKDKIKDLEREATFTFLNHQREIEAMRIEGQEDKRRENEDLRIINAEKSARLAEVEKRWDSSSYKQLSDILKALVVKLPTLDIKELSVHKGD